MINTIKGTLAAIVNTGGTFTVAYPTKKDRGSFSQGVNVKLAVAGRLFSCPDDFTVAYNAANMVVTYNGPSSLPAGAEFYLQLDEPAAAMTKAGPGGAIISKPMDLVALNLGAPGAAAANNIKTSAAQTAAAGAVAPAGGTLVASGVATLDAPTGRNVVAAWTGAAQITIRGLDIYGKAMSEQSGAGVVAFTGKKAFAKVTSIQVSADVTALTVGTGAVLGLPMYVPNAAMILKESVDGAAAVAGTVVVGLNNATKSTTTTNDIRGTYAPNAAPDGSKVFELLVATVDASNTGIAAQA